LLCELSNEVDVDGAPGAGGFPRGEANGVAGFVEALSNAVDPAEAEGYFYGFGPGDAGFSGNLFVEAYDLLAELIVMGFEPGAEVGGGWEEGWFWRHGVCADECSFTIVLKWSSFLKSKLHFGSFGELYDLAMQIAEECYLLVETAHIGIVWGAPFGEEDRGFESDALLGAGFQSSRGSG